MKTWTSRVLTSAGAVSIPLVAMASPTEVAPLPPKGPDIGAASGATVVVATTSNAATTVKKQLSVKVVEDGKETRIEQNADGIMVSFPGKSGETVEVKAKDTETLKSTPEAYEVYRKYVSESDGWSPRVRVLTGQAGQNGFRFVVPPVPDLAPLAQAGELSREDREKVERELKAVRERVRESQKLAIEQQREALREQARAQDALREAMRQQERRLSETRQRLAESSKPRLGIEIDEVDEALKAHVGGGVLVRSVREGSVAATIGLQPLDIIRSVNQTTTLDPDALRKLVAEAQGPLTLDVLRAGKPVTLTVPALDAPPSSTAPAAPADTGR